MYKWNSWYEASVLRSGFGLLLMCLSGPDYRVQFQQEILMCAELWELGREGIIVRGHAERCRTFENAEG